MKKKIRFTLSRQEIEAMDFDRFFEAFAAWPFREGKALGDFYGRLDLWISGYDPLADEELYLIPEVRKYVRQLHKAWPWVAFFLPPDDVMLTIWMLCLVDEVGCVRRQGAGTCHASFNPAEMLDLIAREFGHLNRLIDRAGMAETENERRSHALVARFFPDVLRQTEEGA